MHRFWILVLISFGVPDGGFTTYQETDKTSQNLLDRKKPHLHLHQNIEDLFQETTPSSKLTNQTIEEHSTSTQPYSDWSPWSRCQNCIHRRMKICVSDSCGDTRIYEERPCTKKRCKRKARNKKTFQVVHINQTSNYLMKQGPSDVWTKWSDWVPCLRNCRTFRYRRCRRSKICRKDVQKEEALCYHKASNCELFVLELMENSNGVYDEQRYHYESNNQDTQVSHSKDKVHNSAKKCGIPYRRNKMLKIIGGTNSKMFKWPWHVAIINMRMEVFCGGTLVSSKWVLTANHCIRKFLIVRANAHDLRTPGANDIEMKVSKIFPHPKFDYKTVDNDIALLLLPRALKTPVACLPNKKPRPRQLCSVMGWGKVDPDDMYGVPILQEAKLPIVKSKTCKKSYKQFLISDNMLCAGWASGRADTCAGDSGGGLLCPFKRNSKTVYSVQGITSFGDGCGRRNKYGIYTNVVNYVEWINYVIDHYS